MAEDISPQEVLDFWFGSPDDPDHAMRREVWFKKDDAFDDLIRSQFLASVDEAIDGGLADWEDDGLGSLALILLLDQFTRNLFRGSGRSFAGDVRARELAASVIKSGAEQNFTTVQRSFLYLPFEHGESLADQQRSMALFASLPNHADKENLLDYAQRHLDIIERFGRFPHRNAAMGRASTAAEEEFLNGPNSSF